MQIQASQQVQELKDIILQMFRGNHVVPVGFAAQLEADAAAQAVDDIQEPGQEMSAAPVPMDDRCTMILNTPSEPKQWCCKIT